MVWIQNVQHCLDEKVKNGQEIKRLVNQAVYGHFDIPYDLKCLADLEYKVRSFYSAIKRHRHVALFAAEGGRGFEAGAFEVLGDQLSPFEHGEARG
jgi:hypothetical protein